MRMERGNCAGDGVLVIWAIRYYQKESVGRGVSLHEWKKRRQAEYSGRSQRDFEYDENASRKVTRRAVVVNN